MVLIQRKQGTTKGVFHCVCESIVCEQNLIVVLLAHVFYIREIGIQIRSAYRLF